MPLKERKQLINGCRIRTLDALDRIVKNFTEYMHNDDESGYADIRAISNIYMATEAIKREQDAIDKHLILLECELNGTLP